MEVAKAEAALSAARAFLYDEIAQAWRLAEAAGEIPLAQRARLRLAATHAARTGAETARIAYELAGGAAVYLSNEIQRRLRDGQTAIQHIMVQTSTYELTGRVLLGLDVDASTL
jgi:alkylation response protein AidB-like acyl-CoA dehydrogenase